MDLAHKLNHSGRLNSASNPIWMDGLRIVLGLFLFGKGIMFLERTSDVFYMFSTSQHIFNMEKSTIITSTLHILGGLLIAFGCLTRFSLLCQFPILIGAVLIVNLRLGLQVENTELWCSLIIIGLLLFFMVVGPGRYSVDNKFLRQKQSV